MNNVALPVAIALLITADPPPVQAQDSRDWTGSAAIGPALFAHSRSKTAGHLLKPQARVSLAKSVSQRWEAGLTTVSVLDSSAHYAAAGLMGFGRFAAYQGARLSIGVSGGLGAGRDVDILHGDLSADHPVIPYGFVGGDLRWSFCQRWFAGTEMVFENLSVLRLAAVAGLHFGSKQ